MRTFGLIGYPLSHSFSQGYFSDKFKKEDIEARYLNFPIASINDFKGLLDQHPYLAGLNVTIPYKEQVLPYLDELDDEAAQIGAVNVIKISWNNKKAVLKGFNSDVKGFFNALKPLLQPWHGKALILGTGGASKAVAHALLKAGILYRFVSRNPKGPSQVDYASLTPEIISEYKLIINTSPLGMYPNMERCPELPYEAMTAQHLVFDLIYNPETTLFMKRASENGAVVKNGLEMLHLQAEEAWKIWNK
jgi:shikimate dehydrogenase